MITFNADLHEYRDEKGRLVPSVTQVLVGSGMHDFSGVPKDVLEAACERGTIVHKITELYDKGTLEPGSIDPQLFGYFNAYLGFLAQFRIKRFLAIEALVEGAGYAGTLDRIAASDNWTCLYDIKTGIRHPAHAVQLSAYNQAQKICPNITTVGTLYLSADGKWQFEETRSVKADYLTFMSALNVYNFKYKNNLINSNERENYERYNYAA